MIAGLYWVHWRYERKLHWLQQNAHKDQQEQQYQQLRDDLRHAEAERNRLAKDLHQNISTALSGAQYYLQHLKGHENPQHRYADMASEVLEDVLQQVYDKTNALQPLHLEEYGLEQTLDRYFQRLEAMHNISVDFSFSGKLRRLENDIELAIFRVIEYWTLQAIIEAEADLLDISLAMHPDEIHLACEHNGQDHSDINQTLQAEANKRITLLQANNPTYSLGEAHTEITLPY